MSDLQRDDLVDRRTGDSARSAWGAALPVAGVAVVALLACVAAARFTGASDPLPSGFTDAGPVVRWALPLVRALHDVAASLTVGSLLLAATMIPGRTRAETTAADEPRRAAALRVATAAAFVWAVAGAVVVVFTFADAAGMPLGQPGFGTQLTGALWSIEPLRVGLISTVTAVVVASVAAVARGRLVPVGLAALSAFGLLVLGLAGHAGGSADHETAVNGIAVHLLAAAVWVGGLLALVVLRHRLGDALGVVARRFSTVALWCFIALGVSGVMTASTRLGTWSDLATPYGVLVLVKVAALAVLGVAGAVHRRVTLDRIDRIDRIEATADHDGGRQMRGRLFVRLAVAETLVMGLAFGVATALARSRPPVPEMEPDPTAALSLTGFPAPPPPSALDWVTAWRVEWLFLSTGLLAIALYIAGVVRLRRRGDAWPVLRTVSWVIGWLLFVYATNGVLGIYGRVAFSWHMTLHMVEAMVLPIFLVLGAPVTLALRSIRPRRDGTLGPRELLLRAVHSRLMSVLGNPVVAAVLFFTSLVAFYWTGLFQLALETHTGHLLMTAHFVLTGYLFVWSLVGIDPGPKKWSPPLRLVVLFATISFHAFFGVAMVTGTTLLAGDFFTAIRMPWVPDPLADQRLGGGVAWAIGELPSLVLALTVAVQWFGRDQAESVRRDRRADRDGDAELNAYNERLAALAKRDGDTPR
ncbi:cytochrome c oxidase assembly protein [Terrabacter terrae]|uniref:Cytochrome c oxidase assembly protein n=1 Tax=Terrabacter terrae TaxID=318434 RepID=A0ABN2TQ69_9MICO